MEKELLKIQTVTTCKVDLNGYKIGLGGFAILPSSCQRGCCAPAVTVNEEVRPLNFMPRHL